MGKNNWRDPSVPKLKVPPHDGERPYYGTVSGVRISGGYDWECVVLARDGRRSVSQVSSMQYRSIFSAMRYCLRNQDGWDPYFPATQVARELMGAVKGEYQKRGFDQKLGLFRSVGTVADQFHSVDCFILSEDNKVALIDLTINPKKVNHKNHSCVCIHPEDISADAISETARKIVDILMHKNPFWLREGTEHYREHRRIPGKPGVPGFEWLTELGKNPPP